MKHLIGLFLVGLFLTGCSFNQLSTKTKKPQNFIVEYTIDLEESLSTDACNAKDNTNQLCRYESLQTLNTFTKNEILKEKERLKSTKFISFSNYKENQKENPLFFTNFNNKLIDKTYERCFDKEFLVLKTGEKIKKENSLLTETCFNKELNNTYDRIIKYYSIQNRILDFVKTKFLETQELRSQISDSSDFKSRNIDFKDYNGELIKENDLQFTIATSACDDKLSKETMNEYFICLHNQKYDNKNLNNILLLSAKSIDYIYLVTKFDKLRKSYDNFNEKDYKEFK